jgi:hypothetical protein
MKPALSLTLLVLLAASARPVTAQPLQAFEDLALRVNLDDQLRIEDQSGIKASGRLTRLTRDDLTIQTDAGEKHFSRDVVREVAVRVHSLGRSALIGAGAFAALTAVAAARGNADVQPFAAAALGAGAGLAIGALIPHMKTIYRGEHGAPAASLRDSIGRASLLEDLALRVNLDDQLRVETESGGRTTGRLTALTSDEFTIQTDAGEEHFTRGTVRQVAVRHRPIRAAVLIGAGAGAALGAALACTGPDREECVDGPIMAGALGAGLGLAVGAAIHHTTIVYPEPARRTAVSPSISRHVLGIRLSRRW